jgi:hypothetical protein
MDKSAMKPAEALAFFTFVTAAFILLFVNAEDDKLSDRNFTLNHSNKTKVSAPLAILTDNNYTDFPLPEDKESHSHSVTNEDVRERYHKVLLII